MTLDALPSGVGERPDHRDTVRHAGGTVFSPHDLRTTDTVPDGPPGTRRTTPESRRDRAALRNS
jgi:hypothetical protein